MRKNKSVFCDGLEFLWAVLCWNPMGWWWVARACPGDGSLATEQRGDRLAVYKTRREARKRLYAFGRSKFQTDGMKVQRVDLKVSWGWSEPVIRKYEEDRA